MKISESILVFSAALAMMCILSSCDISKKDIIVDVPDRMYNTEWVGATSTTTWSLVFGTESQAEDCSFFLKDKSGKQTMLKYKYSYIKPVLRLTPAPGYEGNVDGTATVSNGSSGIMMTLSLETYPDIALYLQQ